MIELTCPNCGATYHLDRALATRKAVCTECKTVMDVPPEPQPVAVGAPAPPAAAAAPPPAAPAPAAPAVPAAPPAPPLPPVAPPAAAAEADVPMAVPAEQIPMARPTGGGWRLLLLAGIAAGVLAVAVVLVVVLLPKTETPYNIEELNRAVDQAQQLAEEALPPDTEVDSLDEAALIKARDGLRKAVEAYEQVRGQLEPLEEHASADGDLQDLIRAVRFRFPLVTGDLRQVADALWPRPGDFAEMAARISPSVPVVMAQGRGRSGTGFLIRHEHRYYVATNRHVVERGDDGFRLRFLVEQKGEVRPAMDIDVEPDAVVFVHRHSDLAVIRIGKESERLESEGIRPLTMAKEVKVGEEVWVIGHPGAGKLGLLKSAFDKGYVSFIKDDSPDDPGVIRITAPINKGNSGGPVLNGEGRVVGVVYGGIQGKNDMNFAVHIHKLRSLLDQQREQWSDNLDANQIRLIVEPKKEFPKEFERRAAFLKSQGYTPHKWAGPKAEPFFVLPPSGSRTLEFQATKGRRYRVVVVTARARDVDYRVRRKGSKEYVYVKTTGHGSAEIKGKRAESSSDFEAAADGRYQVEFKSLLPQMPIAAYARVLSRMKELEFRIPTTRASEETDANTPPTTQESKEVDFKPPDPTPE